jgi:hypothetical protein
LQGTWSDPQDQMHQSVTLKRLPAMGERQRAKLQATPVKSKP